MSPEDTPVSTLLDGAVELGLHKPLRSGFGNQDQLHLYVYKGQREDA